MSSKVDLKNVDLVYPVRKLPEGNSELRYSLRSVAKNLPHRKIWVIGDDIAWLSPKVGKIQMEDGGKAFWNVNQKLMTAVEDGRITDPFIFMMDDIFVMKKVRSIPYYAINHRLGDRLTKYDNFGPYAQDLTMAREILWWLKEDEVDFEAHAPILFRKSGLKRILRRWPESGHRRSLYANIYHKRPKYVDDFKIYHAEDDPEPGAQYFSSAVESWRDGSKLYGLVTSTFTEPCEYEAPEMIRCFREG